MWQALDKAPETGSKDDGRFGSAFLKFFGDYQALSVLRCPRSPKELFVE